MLVLQHNYPLHVLLLASVATVILKSTFQHVNLIMFNNIELLNHFTFLSRRIKPQKKCSLIRPALCNESTKIPKDELRAKNLRE